MGKGSSSAPSPDPAIGQAALKNAALGEEWLSYAKDQSKVANARQEKTDELSAKVTQAALDTQAENNANAREQYQYYKDTFKPIEQQVADEAANYDSAERKDSMAGQAAMEVSKQMAAARDSNTRSMARMGVNPNSGKFQASTNAIAAQEGLARAAASTKARTDAENMGIMLRKDAANFGRNMTGTAAQSYSTALNAGNSATASNATANQSFLNNQSIMSSGMQGAIGANNSAASILNTQYANQLNSWNAQQQADAQGLAGIGSMVGMLGGAAIKAWSDETLKEDKEPIDEDKALESVAKTPVEQWKYKDGVADGGTHIGPYAQDVQKNMGDQVAPEGRMIDLVSMNGINMAAIKSLNKKVSKIEKRLPKATAPRKRKG